MSKKSTLALTMACVAIAAVPCGAAEIATLDVSGQALRVYDDNTGSNIVSFLTTDLSGGLVTNSYMAVGDADSTYTNSEIVTIRTDGYNVIDIYNASITPNVNGSYQTQNGFYTSDPGGASWAMMDITVGNVFAGEGGVIIALRSGGWAIDFFSSDANRDDRWGTGNTSHALTYGLGISTATQIASGYVSGDSNANVVTLGTDGNIHVYTLSVNSDNTVASVETSFANTNSSTYLAVADVDSNNDGDEIITAVGNLIDVYSGSGTLLASFTTIDQYGGTSDVIGISAGDVYSANPGGEIVSLRANIPSAGVLDTFGVDVSGPDGTHQPKDGYYVVEAMDLAAGNLIPEPMTMAVLVLGGIALVVKRK